MVSGTQIEAIWWESKFCRITFSIFWPEVSLMKESNWDNFLRELKVASNANIGLIFLVFLCSELIFAFVIEVVVLYGGKKSGLGDIGNCRSLKEI